MSPTFGLVTSTSSGIVATGGTITTVGGYKIHIFTSGSVNFVVSANPNNELFQVLAIGGGGSGGQGNNAGGGAYVNAGAGGVCGAMVSNTYSIANGTHAVTIGGSTGSTSLGSIVTANGGTGGSTGASPSQALPVFPAMGVVAAEYNPPMYWGTTTAGSTFTSSITGTSVNYGGIGAGGQGGNSYGGQIGGGGAGGVTNGAGSAGTTYGSGGGGGGSKTTNGTTAGGAGYQGYLVVRYRA